MFYLRQKSQLYLSGHGISYTIIVRYDEFYDFIQHRPTRIAINRRMFFAATTTITTRTQWTPPPIRCIPLIYGLTITPLLLPDSVHRTRPGSDACFNVSKRQSRGTAYAPQSLAPERETLRNGSAIIHKPNKSSTLQSAQRLFATRIMAVPLHNENYCRSSSYLCNFFTSTAFVWNDRFSF